MLSTTKPPVYYIQNKHKTQVAGPPWYTLDKKKERRRRTHKGPPYLRKNTVLSSWIFFLA